MSSDTEDAIVGRDATHTEPVRPTYSDAQDAVVGNDANHLTTSYETVPQAGMAGTVTGWAKAVKDNLVDSYQHANEPGPPVEPGPFLRGIPYGARHLTDAGAEKLAGGWDALTGSNYAGPIRADMDARTKAYEADPMNNPKEWPATIGRGVGESALLAGPLGKIGAEAATLLKAGGAAAYAPVARALEYLSGTAKAAPEAGKLAQVATRAGSLSAQGGASGGGAAAIDADHNKPYWPQVGEGALAGTVAGPVAGAAFAGLSYPFRAAMGLLPNMVKDDSAALADRLIREHGVKLDPSMLTDNQIYRAMADQAGKLPFSGAASRIAEARLSWQQAYAREMGEVAAPKGMTHEVMDAAANRIGGGMNDIAARTTIQGGAPLHAEMSTIAQDIPKFGLTKDQIAPVAAQAQNVLEAFKNGGGKISGETYQNLTQTGGPLDAAIRHADPTVSAFALRIKDALDNAFQRSATPGDVAALKDLRYQYRVMKTAQPLVEKSPGDINPNLLLERVRAQSAKFDSANGGLAYTGGGRLGDLAYGGQKFFGKSADSNTTNRALITGLITGAGGTGSGLTAFLGHPQIAAAPALGLGLNNMAQRMLRSTGVGSNMVANTLVPPGPVAQRMNPLLVPGLLGIRPTDQAP